MLTTYRPTVHHIPAGHPTPAGAVDLRPSGAGGGGISAFFTWLADWKAADPRTCEVVLDRIRGKDLVCCCKDIAGCCPARHLAWLTYQ